MQIIQFWDVYPHQRLDFEDAGPRVPGGFEYGGEFLFS